MSPDPVEMPPEGPSTLGLWSMFLAGPVLWAAHFGVVYFTAEAVCAAETDPAIRFLGSEGFVALVSVLTALGVGASAALAMWSRRVARRSDGDRGAFAWMGVLLAAGAGLAIAAVGVPALFLETCAP